MKKNLSLLLILFCLVSLSLSADWEIENKVDKFGDQLNSIYLASVADDSTMSNTATVSSKAKVRVILDWNHAMRPKFVFDIHDYNWNNPVDSNILRDRAEWSFKDNLNRVLRISGSSDAYWNVIDGEDAITLYEFIYYSDYVKCYVSLGSSEYNFTIRRANLNEVLRTNNIAFNLTPMKDMSSYGKPSGKAVDLFEDKKPKRLFPVNTKLALSAYGLGPNVYGNGKDFDWSFSCGAAFGFEYYFNSHGIVTNLGYVHNGKGDYFDFNLGYGFRKEITKEILFNLKVLTGMSLDLAEPTKDTGEETITLNAGVNIALETDFEWYFNPNWYLWGGIGFKASDFGNHTEGAEVISANITVTFPLGIGYAFDM